MLSACLVLESVPAALAEHLEFDAVKSKQSRARAVSARQSTQPAINRAWDRLRALSQPLTRRFWLATVVACALNVGVELIFEQLIESPTETTRQVGLIPAGIYQFFVTRAAAPIVNRTVIVE